MAFGKIVIQHESGEQQIFEIEKVTTSIGRQAGNDIVLNTTAVSRYHAQLLASEGRVYLVDLGTVNGTFVNDQQITPESNVELNEGDVVTLGDINLVFYPRQVRSDISLTPQVEVIEQEGIPFRLYVEEPMQTVSPGARLRLAVVIENLAEGEQMYSVGVGGLDRKWAGANRQQVRLDPGEQTEVTVSVRPPRTTDTRYGVYPLTVTVALNDDPSKSLQAVREIDVVGYSGFGMVLKQGNQPELFHVAAQNQGNQPLDVKMGGYNREKRLRYKFEPGEVHLEAGETQQITLTVFDQADMPGSDPIPFVVVARSLDASGYQAPIFATYWPGGPVKTERRAGSFGIGLPVLVIGALALGVVLVGALVLTGILFGGRDKGTSGQGDFTQTTPDSGQPQEVPTTIPTDAMIEPPPASLTPTLEPVVEPSPTLTATQTRESLPDDVVGLTFALIPPPALQIPFGAYWRFAFQWGALPEDIAEVWVQAGGGPLTDPEPVAPGQTDFIPMEVYRVVQKIGWGLNEYKLYGRRSGESDGIELGKAQANIISRACVLADVEINYLAAPDASAPSLGGFASGREIVVIGKFNSPTNGDTWLRVAAFDPAQLDPLLAANHRWVALTDPALVTCDGVPINLDDYASIPGDPVPQP